MKPHVYNIVIILNVDFAQVIKEWNDLGKSIESSMVRMKSGK